MAKLGRLEMVLSQLPDISLAEFNFLDSSFFSSQYGACTCRKLPSPQEVLGASGTPSGYDGVWHFQELGVLIKFGHPSRVDLEEALALRFINKMFPADEVPAPEVFGWKSTRDHPGYESNFIYMSFLPGQTLRDAWETLSQEDKASVSQQLAGIVKRLRSVERGPADQFIVGSLSRGPVQDVYFSPDQHKGPFASAREFHDFVQYVSAAWVPVEERDPDPFRVMLPDTARRLTHGDLHLANILVLRSPDGSQISVSGMVDWEQAGWYPDYWEYCKAMIVGPYGDEWREAGWVDIVLQPCECEFEAFEAFEFYWGSRCP
ncbi:kinase-like domain-containing protein [Diplogelasinospora grovesii]|uniref:Kinase-like domain-containing protein n=1 Tax=Diplogelasinospora grovesii TaxID=303347 RepID=A0AAN6S5X6_9PEZI|nr:kinase-like domain-containing protein [Diplogelasinospora grovesii]